MERTIPVSECPGFVPEEPFEDGPAVGEAETTGLGEGDAAGEGEAV
jgi:hypothetical protein